MKATDAPLLLGQSGVLGMELSRSAVLGMHTHTSQLLLRQRKPLNWDDTVALRGKNTAHFYFPQWTTLKNKQSAPIFHWKISVLVWYLPFMLDQEKTIWYVH